MAAAITFLGAAQTVTGSKHLIHNGKAKVLVDCGLFQGPHDLRSLNWEPFDFPIGALDAVIVTHAHLDHTGMLPRLVRNGYEGPIYCTHSTAQLMEISLPDSARLQEEDARYLNRHGLSRHHPALPLYTEDDAYATLKQLRRVKFHQMVDLPGGGSWRFVPAGHILGSAFAEIYFANGERILMSGDLGRPHRPIIADPTTVDYAEYLVLESTYGDRLHSEQSARDVLRRLLREAFEQSSVVLVPSFAIGRTQELLYEISHLVQEGSLPRVPIFLDSPMATSVTHVYAKAVEEHDEDMRAITATGLNPLEPASVTFVRDSMQSKALNARQGPMMIISGSGMAAGGRIVHHLRNRLPDERTVVLFTGYQAAGTTGRKLVDGARQVELHGEVVPVRARIEMISSLSAHADYGEILSWLENFTHPPKQTFLVHGELPAQEALRERITQRFGWNVVIPKRLDHYAL